MTNRLMNSFATTEHKLALELNDQTTQPYGSSFIKQHPETVAV